MRHLHVDDSSNKTKSQTTFNYSAHSHNKEDTKLIKHHRLITKIFTIKIIRLRSTDYHLENSLCNCHRIASHNNIIKCVLTPTSHARCISEWSSGKNCVATCKNRKNREKVTIIDYVMHYSRTGSSVNALNGRGTLFTSLN